MGTNKVGAPLKAQKPQRLSAQGDFRDIFKTSRVVEIYSKARLPASKNAFILIRTIKILILIKTSRERPKSAPYLRLEIEKGDPSGFVKLQLVAKNEKN